MGDVTQRCISAPAKVHNFATKSGSRSKPSPAPPSISKRSRINLFPVNDAAAPVFFTKPVELSTCYVPQESQSYMDQMFIKIGVVGEGSFGVVHKARSIEDNKIYAIKQMKISHSKKHGREEVKNYEKVGEHNNCVKFILAWEQMEMIYIKMEYCGLSLAQYASLVQTLSESQLLDVLYDILNGLNFLHERNLIHLDVKPANILMSHNFYKLADFGLLVDLNKADGKKISTLSDGDAKYLAAEVLNGTYTYACDIFGLGITALELATNIELPEYGFLWHEIRKQLVPDEFCNKFSMEFTSLIKSMMDNEYWKRPEASEILRNQFLQQVPQRDAVNPRFTYYDEDREEDEAKCIPLNNNNVIVREKAKDCSSNIIDEVSKKLVKSTCEGNKTPPRREHPWVRLSF